MIGSCTVFKGFDVNNPQHLAWAKRKMLRANRYERRFARKSRQPSGLESLRLQPRHRKSRRPERSYWWEREIITARHAVTGKPTLATRAQLWAELQKRKQMGGEPR